MTETSSIRSAPTELTECAFLVPDAAAPDGVRRTRAIVNRAESALGWLHGRGLVSDCQLAAGEVLRQDFEQAQLGPRVTMRWDVMPGRGALGGGAMHDATTRQLAAKARFDAALDHLGTGLRDIAWRIICAGEGMTTAERALSWPARSGRLVLGLALDRLADFYRLR